jgi:hypothetical protein
MQKKSLKLNSIQSFFDLIKQSYSSEPASQEVMKKCEEDEQYLHCQNKENFRPLDFAAFHGCSQLVFYFVKKGINPNEPNKRHPWGYPVQMAVTKGHILTINLLIELGADPRVIDSYNNGLVKLMKLSDNLDCVEFCNEAFIKRARAKYLIGILNQKIVLPHMVKALSFGNFGLSSVYTELLDPLATHNKEASTLLNEICDHLFQHSDRLPQYDAVSFLSSFIPSPATDTQPETYLKRLLKSRPDLNRKIKTKIEQLDRVKDTTNAGLKLLPQDVWQQIFLYCAKDFRSLARTCKYFEGIVTYLQMQKLKELYHVTNQPAYDFSFLGSRFIQYVFTQKMKTLVTVQLETTRGLGAQTFCFYPRVLECFFDRHQDIGVWLVIADNLYAFQQYCEDHHLALGQRHFYLPLALALGRSKIVQYLLQLAPKIKKLFSSTLECYFDFDTHKKLLECAIVSRKPEIVRAVIKIPGARSTTVDIKIAVATGNLEIFNLVLSFLERICSVTDSMISTAINSGNCKMFDAVIELGKFPITEEQCNEWHEWAVFAFGEESEMAVHIQSLQVSDLCRKYN